MTYNGFAERKRALTQLSALEILDIGKENYFCVLSKRTTGSLAAPQYPELVSSPSGIIKPSLYTAGIQKGL